MAFKAYVSIRGTKQGQFKGESSDPKSDLIPIVDFQNRVTLPIDLSSGTASGKRQHSPVTITKEWGASSPQFFQALSTSEILETVSMEFFRPASNGKEEVFFTIVLTKAFVCEIRQFIGSAPGSPDAANELEAISFTYQKIEIKDTIANTSAIDAWVASSPEAVKV
jgi:type VI secretion system secreted protein Hcp